MASGALWVERWPPEGRPGVRSYDVLGPDGSLRRRVLLQAPLVDDPPPYVQGDFGVGVVRDPETDVERVVRFDMPDVPG